MSADRQRFLSHAFNFDGPDGGRVVVTPALPPRINNIVFPRKMTACQYMIASGDMQCYRKGCFPPTMGPDASVNALVPALMAVDEAIATEVGPGGSMEWFFSHLMALTPADSGPATAEEQPFVEHLQKFLVSGNATYLGFPIRHGGRVIGSFCSAWYQLPADEGVPAAARAAMEEALATIEAVLERGVAP